MYLITRVRSRYPLVIPRFGKFDTPRVVLLLPPSAQLFHANKAGEAVKRHGPRVIRLHEGAVVLFLWFLMEKKDYKFMTNNY